MCDEITINTHSSIRIEGSKIIYIDPYGIEKSNNDADYIFITHEHFDHYDTESIAKIIKNGTIVIAPETMKDIISSKYECRLCKPNENYTLEKVEFETRRAYNKILPFHPKSKNWLGYVIKMDNKTYYITGDTDALEENNNVICDVLLVPVGGTYTCNAKEAAKFASQIKPEYVIPTHYGSVAGNKKDGINFKEELEKICKASNMTSTINICIKIQ